MSTDPVTDTTIGRPDLLPSSAEDIRSGKLTLLFLSLIEYIS